MNLFKRKHKKSETASAVSDNFNNSAPLSNAREQYDRQESEAMGLLINGFGYDLGRHIHREFGKVLSKSDKIFVSLRFDWGTYKSDIVMTGRNYDRNGYVVASQECLIRTPQLPLMGAAWSNTVAMRMLQGQIFVSAMLENVANALRYMEYNYWQRQPEIIKVDRCLYAPLLYLITNETESWLSVAENREYVEPKIEYMAYLWENHPQAYRYLMGSTGTDFWGNYHDADVEQEWLWES